MAQRIKRSPEAPEATGNTVKTVNTVKTTSKKESPMSTQETPKPETKKIDKTFKFFNLDSMKLVSMKIEGIEFTPAADSKEAFERLGNDEKVLLSALNSVLEAQVVADAKKAKVPANAAPKKVVLDFIKSFRVSPTFSSLVTLEKGDKGWKEQYDAQTVAILSQVKNVSFMMDNLKAIAASTPDSEEDGSEE